MCSDSFKRFQFWITYIKHRDNSFNTTRSHSPQKKYQNFNVVNCFKMALKKRLKEKQVRKFLPVFFLNIMNVQ